MNDKLVIFDMDGTLVDTRKDITLSINYVRGTKSLPPLSESEVIKIINSKREELAMKFYGTETYLPEDRALFEEHYKEQCTKNVVLFDGVYDTLELLKKMNIKLSVATNAPTKFGERILLAAGIGGFFDYIVGACKVKKPKPDREMVDYINNFYGNRILSAQNTLIVGDNYTDINAGLNAGITSVFVKWGYGTFHEEFKPHYSLSSFDEILDII